MTTTKGDKIKTLSPLRRHAIKQSSRTTLVHQHSRCRVDVRNAMNDKIHARSIGAADYNIVLYTLGSNIRGHVCQLSASCGVVRGCLLAQRSHINTHTRTLCASIWFAQYLHTSFLCVRPCVRPSILIILSRSWSASHPNPVARTLTHTRPNRTCLRNSAHLNTLLLARVVCFGE